MSRHRTGTSSSYGATDAAFVGGGPESASKPGLVLLYARNFEQFLPAYPFHKPAVVIGRDATADVCVPEQAVSRQHARIHFDGGRWVLTDLGSRNGTMVDGAFITHDVELEHLHEIRVGDALFKFVASDAERYGAYHIDGRVLGERRARSIKSLVGGCQMDLIAADLEKIAPTQLSCVILGETGTGKEVAARELHRVSERKGSLQAINCAAIPHNLLESELFGYRRGAFSGADRDKPGLIKLADGGTLFLDEIGDMPMEAQAKLLRVLQSREVFPLGGTAPERVDVRVVCATHRDLDQYVKEGKFRGDLFARVSEHMVKLPPLRERKEDVYQLARLFGARYGQETSRGGLEFSFSFVVALLHHDWPFNVRELESCIKRATALAEGNMIDVGQLPETIAALMRDYGTRASPTSLSEPPRESRMPQSNTAPPPPVASSRRPPPTEVQLRDLLTRHRGNIAAVGRELGKERMQVHRWMKRYGISVEEYRDD
ncbi:MAG TPA: sigma 54-interacting transcriptional regulator [Polyangiaceae bacterium]|jgi:transcriptional regulator with GAF, ATPase, and Fis domain